VGIALVPLSAHAPPPIQPELVVHPDGNRRDACWLAPFGVFVLPDKRDLFALAYLAVNLGLFLLLVFRSLPKEGNGSNPSRATDTAPLPTHYRWATAIPRPYITRSTGKRRATRRRSLRPRRFSLQFRARSLFILTTVVAIAVGYVVAPFGGLVMNLVILMLVLLVVCWPRDEAATDEAATMEAFGRDLGKRWASVATKDQVRQVQDAGNASEFATDVWKQTAEGKQRAEDFVATHRFYVAGVEWRPPQEFVRAFNDAVLASLPYAGGTQTINSKATPIGSFALTAPTHSWPLASHFSTILQNPRIAFRAVELKELRIERDALNQPRAWSGAFATVFKGVNPNGQGAVAIRVFTTASSERRERYNAIYEHLHDRGLKSLVGFTYADDGIRSAGDGRWYPLVTMEWVSGETLYDWTRTQCLNGNRAAISKVAEKWLELLQELTAAEVAHGDLQHANIMVTDDHRLKLVDYDCMCVPMLVGRNNLEIGVEPYQHPDRNDQTSLSLQLDNYSALFILVALKALAAAPDLWQTYVERPKYDKLLLRRGDLVAPNRSPLIAALRRSPDVQVRQLTERLLHAASSPMHVASHCRDRFSSPTLESRTCWTPEISTGR
jgi:hypothetical protein